MRRGLGAQSGSRVFQHGSWYYLTIPRPFVYYFYSTPQHPLTHPYPPTTPPPGNTDVAVVQANEVIDQDRDLSAPYRLLSCVAWSDDRRHDAVSLAEKALANALKVHTTHTPRFPNTYHTSLLFRLITPTRTLTSVSPLLSHFLSQGRGWRSHTKREGRARGSSVSQPLHAALLRRDLRRTRPLWASPCPNGRRYCQRPGQ